MTEGRRPIHLAILIGVSTGAYAVSLAGMASLQSASDIALIAVREPIGLAASSAAAGHDGLESTLEEASRRYSVLASRYDTLTPTIGELEISLDGLAARADSISQTVSALPTRISLPKVPALPAARPAARPVTHATTGASG